MRRLPRSARSAIARQVSSRPAHACRSCCCMALARARRPGCAVGVTGETRRQVLAWDAPGYGESTPRRSRFAGGSGLRRRIERLARRARDRTLRAAWAIRLARSSRARLRGAIRSAWPDCCCCRRRAVMARRRRKCAKRSAMQRLAMLAELGPQGLGRKTQRQYGVRPRERRQRGHGCAGTWRA